jgi:Xaa-Pro aminopeptidase
VYLNSNEHPRAKIEIETREMRFVHRCFREYPLHRYERLAPLMHELRAIKSGHELVPLNEAIRITDLGFRRLLKFVKPGVHEFEIEAELAHEYLRHRASGFAYPPIIASGANACVLHYVTNDAPCNDGDMLLLDVAARYGNYNADLTRTIPVNGRFTDRQRAVYNAVLRVFRACCQMLRPGVIIHDYQKEVGKLMESELIGLGLLKREDIDKQDPDKPLFKKYFPHGTSHHLGLDVHDVGNTWKPIQPGMVFTVEPGIYIRDEKLGIRLENNILIGAEKNTDLMAGIPIEAEEIEEMMHAS